MIQVGNTILSLDILEKEFCCNLDVCHGCCCIEGDAGAPLEDDEVQIIERLLPRIWNDLTPEARQIIEQQGVSYLDKDGERVTSIVNNKDCVFARVDNTGMCYCVFDRAFRAGRIEWQKPISCHLYPIRVKKFGDLIGLNYHRWDICHCARQLGKKEHLKVYQFLREPLIRRFGQQWYEELENVAQEWQKRCEK
ncbi:MAG: DUF3109 family protein [Paludibacteraceae bacterium]|nr:DUF3109 family protein [Paludibacteraceae bacterium]